MGHDEQLADERHAAATAFVSPDALRKRFFAELSRMYAEEVPLYATLLETVREVNAEVNATYPVGQRLGDAEIDEVSSERHGAIRLGKPEELQHMVEFFGVIGMEAVNFYNLADAGAKSQPVISTAFRPPHDCDQRIFCSLLMPEYFDDAMAERLRDAVKDREIFSPALLEMVATCQAQGGLTEEQAQVFIAEGAQMFKWRKPDLDVNVGVDHDLYVALRDKFQIAADVACFLNPHLNHLTPNCLDLDLLFERMQQKLGSQFAPENNGMKDSIEGPPTREAIVLLQQVSYKALSEAVAFFRDGDDPRTAEPEFREMHRARFGEIERRGVAMTPEGRALYDAAIKETQDITIDPAKDYDGYVAAYAACFDAIPHTHEELRTQRLAYYTYQVADAEAAGRIAREALDGAASGRPLSVHDLADRLVAAGVVAYEPIRYEDFLPVSAAGIFASNLSTGYGTVSTNPDMPTFTRETLERLMTPPDMLRLGRTRKIIESDDIYSAEQAASMLALVAALGVDDHEHLSGVHALRRETLRDPARAEGQGRGV